MSAPAAPRSEGAPAAPEPTAAAVALARAALRSGEYAGLTTEERERVGALLGSLPVVRDTEREFADESTLGGRVADRVAAFGGSWTFIGLFAVFMLAWAVLNTEILGPRRDAFDPYPYVFLNLMLSMLAALQAPVIMMSQNRQSARDRVEARNDYEVNLRAELEIRALRAGVEELRHELAAVRALLATERGAPAHGAPPGGAPAPADG